jgi:GxxExxY protein
MMRMRIPSPLSEELDNLVRKVIGACIRVHSELGPGLLETSYSRALARELGACRIPFDVEVVVPVIYRGEAVSHQRIDLFVDRQIVVEVKAVERLAPIHIAQVLSYLKVTGVRVGLLVNFNATRVQEGLRRVVL